MGKKNTIKDSGSNSVQTDATGGLISANANQEINFSAPKINMKADIEFNVQALKGAINAEMNLDIKANAMVNIAGSAMVGIKGALVKFNS